MRLMKIKDQDNLGVFSEIVSLQVVDGNVEAVVIKHKGEELRIVSMEAYSKHLKLLVEEAKEEKKVYRVEGTFMGMTIVPKDFDGEYDAKNYIIEMNGKLHYSEEHSLDVKVVSVLTNKTSI